MLSKRKYELLKMLDSGPARFTDVMKALRITKKRVAVHINQLEDGGLIRKNENTGLYEITEAGRKERKTLELFERAKVSVTLPVVIDNAVKLVLSDELGKQDISKIRLKKFEVEYDAKASTTRFVFHFGDKNSFNTAKKLLKSSPDFVYALPLLVKAPGS